jgi:hypothetical protein
MLPHYIFINSLFLAHLTKPALRQNTYHSNTLVCPRSNCYFATHSKLQPNTTDGSKDHSARNKTEKYHLLKITVSYLWSHTPELTILSRYFEYVLILPIIITNVLTNVVIHFSVVVDIQMKCITYTVNVFKF